MDLRRLTCLLALAALAVFSSPESLALGLGHARGAVFIGRPLNVAIPATMESDDPASPCVDADVFQGDSRMNARRVTTQWEPAASGGGTVRVLSESVVEEPVVTIYLRVGCLNKITRRYVLLAEQPPDAEPFPAARATPPLVRPSASSVSAVPSAVPRALPSGAPSAVPAAVSASPAALPAPLPRAEPLRIQPAPRIEPKKSLRRTERAAASKPPSVVRAESRLKLEPLDLSTERDPSLKTTQRLQAAPSMDDPTRQQAAAMWRVLSAGPEEAIRNGERIVALEREMRSLHDLVTRNTAAVELMREQTEKARGERNLMATLALFLGIGLVAAVIAAVWVARSRFMQPRAKAAWWGAGAQPAEADSEFDESMQAEPRRAAPAEPPAARASEAPDIDLSEAPALEAPQRAARSREALAERAPSSRWSNSDFSSSLPGSARNLKAEELIDIQQQADFFLSIGQPERAIALLENHLQQQGETSALAWLDLLEIYHDLGQREEYDRVRGSFQDRFNAHVPEFDDYRRESAGLENYGRALSRIESLWPGHRVLEVIEESLLRRPGADDSEGFDLEAYRELVLLYNIAREVATRDDRETAPTKEDTSKFFETQVQPLSALQPHPGVGEEPTDFLELEPNTGVDIDLEFLDPPPGAPGAAPAPQVEEPLIGLDELDWRSLRR
ncbi:MAG TPA: hypothetical protein VHA82_23205 [Ramlibacter sp.]|uniref:type IV pilus assembly protein FimV n=1 Tax=Ramlibacter sp. TaxID=1917967 RepID=UPI002CC3199B|nr:hypothetical protein [Ramlibacter sp.]HVZ46734.1 hypothetical protein [Ramlibacter sp.]